MKSFKKHTFIFLFLLIGLFFINVQRVNAQELKEGSYAIQCIYGDGGLYKMSLSAIDSSKKIMNRYSYNLDGITNSNNVATSSTTFANNVNKGSKDVWECKDSVYSTIYSYEDEDENDVTMSYYKFGTAFEADDFERNNQDKNFWQWLFGNNSSNADEAIKNQSSYALKSEQYVIDSDAPAPNVSLFYASKAKQAAGTDKYIEIMVYDNVILVRNDTITTRIDSGLESLFTTASRDNEGKVTVDSSIEYLCITDPTAVAVTNADGNIAYKFNSIMFKASASTKTGNCSGETTKYELTDEIIDLDGVNKDDLCVSIMPNTAVVLSKIIKYIQFLAPVFLIVLTAIDIGKIVVAGNIEEELPKQKSKIIRRFIATVVIFFLPIVINILIDALQDSGAANSDIIRDIGCIFK